MEKRLSDVLDVYFWWFIWLLPLIGAVICLFMGDGNSFADFATFLASFEFGYVADLLTDLEGVLSFTFPSVLKSYASYVVAVELLHIFVDLLVFVPRFCHKITDPDFYACGGKRK